MEKNGTRRLEKLEYGKGKTYFLEASTNWLQCRAATTLPACSMRERRTPSWSKAGLRALHGSLAEKEKRKQTAVDVSGRVGFGGSHSLHDFKGAELEVGLLGAHFQWQRSWRRRARVRVREKD